MPFDFEQQNGCSICQISFLALLGYSVVTRVQEFQFIFTAEEVREMELQKSFCFDEQILPNILKERERYSGNETAANYGKIFGSVMYEK